MLYHGFSSGIEYQDKTTFMGTGLGCPAITEKVRDSERDGGACAAGPCAATSQRAAPCLRLETHTHTHTHHVRMALAAHAL